MIVKAVIYPLGHTTSSSMPSMPYGAMSGEVVTIAGEQHDIVRTKATNFDRKSAKECRWAIDPIVFSLEQDARRTELHTSVSHEHNS